MTMMPSANPISWKIRPCCVANYGLCSDYGCATGRGNICPQKLLLAACLASIPDMLPDRHDTINPTIPLKRIDKGTERKETKPENVLDSC